MHGRLHGRAVTGSRNLNSGKCSRYQESGKAHNQVDILVHATFLQRLICLRRTDTNCLRDCPLRVSGTRGGIAKSGLIVALVLLPLKMQTSEIRPKPDWESLAQKQWCVRLVGEYQNHRIPTKRKVCPAVLGSSKSRLYRWICGCLIPF